MTIEKICIRCKKEETVRNVLINCEIDGCYIHIHDGCLGPTEGKSEHGRLIWLCSYHYRMPRDEGGIQGNMLNKTHEQGQSFVNISSPNERLRNVTVRKHNNTPSIDDLIDINIANVSSNDNRTVSQPSTSYILNKNSGDLDNNLQENLESSIAHSSTNDNANNSDQNHNSHNGNDNSEMICSRCNEIIINRNFDCIGCLKHF